MSPITSKRSLIPAFGLTLVATLAAGLFAKPTTQPSGSLSGGEVSCAMPGGGGCADGAEGEETAVAMLFDRATAVSDVETSAGNGLRFQFAMQPGLLNELVKVMDGSQEGCKGLRSTLAVNPQAGEITLDLVGPAGTAEKLRKL